MSQADTDSPTTTAPSVAPPAPSKKRWSTVWMAITTRRALSAREVAVAWLGLAILCALAYAPHVRHGGFYSDDWYNASVTFQTVGGASFGNVMSTFADIGIYRPVLVMYVPVVYWVLGMDMTLHLAWAATLAMLAAGMLYGVLRMVEVPRIHAWIIAGLLVVYPWADSTKLWTTGAQVTLSVTLALAGLWLALVGLSRRSWRWHAGAAFLYLLSILAYEIALPLIATAGALYTARVGWAAARSRWGVDLAVVLAGGLWVGTQTERSTSGLSDNIAHLGEIITGGGTVLGRTIQPVGAQETTLALSALAVVLAIGVFVYMLSRDRDLDRSGWGLREWLLLAGGGLCVAALGWVMFIPAHPYYTPSIYGVTNRVNGLAAVGLVITAYATLGVIGALIGRLSSRLSSIAVVTTLALAVVMGLAYVDVLRRHIQIWDTAHVSVTAGMDRIRSQFPDLPPRTTLFASGYPGNQTLGVPIFSATWDVYGMVKTMYDDGTISAYPVLYGSRLTCRGGGIQLQGEGLEEKARKVVPYGRAQLYDLRSGAHDKPRDPRECRSVVDGYRPGIVYLSWEY